MLHIIKSYLKFLWNSKNQHGVHSPFVYNLVTKCFYDKKKYPEYSILKDYRNSLLQNKNTIEVTDFGAGSRVFKSNTRAINQIAKNAGISSKRAELLFRIVNYFQPKNILEIGTSLGLATSALSLGLEAKTNRAKLNSKSKIITLEGCPKTMSIAKNQCEFQNLNNIEFVNTKFEDFLKNPKPETRNPKLIYFDGNHSKKATLEYFELLLPSITNDSIWIFDDIHWSKDMEEAWEIIKNHHKVTVTIDTFQWGIVFFRTEQEKEHFVIRV
ncbi:O-methyltransferase [Flavobacterium sp.]|uniref:O-methyltransferase n=1 Tax=Flavobacterium sp. TaxID=239 RepID=UPI00262C9B02|nr:class I SAM-dependent methyltransferase [Flavobacterium sp.]